MRTGWLTYRGDARGMVDGKSIFGPSLDGKWFQAIDYEVVIEFDTTGHEIELFRVEFEEVER